MTLVQKDFIKERDAQLARWFAEGLHDDDVLDNAQEQRLDLSLEGIADKRIELRSKTMSILPSVVGKRYSQISRTHQAARLHELNELAQVIWEGIEHSRANEHWTRLPKLADAHMRCLRQIAEEVHDLEPVGRNTNVWMTYVEGVPMHARQAILGDLQTMHAKLEAQRQLALNEAPDLPIIEAEPSTQ